MNWLEKKAEETSAIREISRKQLRKHILGWFLRQNIDIYKVIRILGVVE